MLSIVGSISLFWPTANKAKINNMFNQQCWTIWPQPGRKILSVFHTENNSFVNSVLSFIMNKKHSRAAHSLKKWVCKLMS